MASSGGGFTEDELLAAIRKILSGEGPGVLVGPGDDAAVLERGRGNVVATTDMLVEGVHFDSTLTSPRDLGYKAIAVNVSDVAAMAGSPRFALVSLGLSDGTQPSWIIELFGGMRAACDEYVLSLVGGDLSRAPQTVVSVTVLGEVAGGRAVLRSGARPGDRIVVTGSLGASAGGLLLARSDHASAAQPWGRALLDAHFRPTARVGEAATLAQAGATAMMDISDGLLLDLWRMCQEGAVGARLELARVPVAPELSELSRILDADPLELATSGGEDYELLSTFDADAVEGAAEKLGKRYAVSLTDIGEITEQGLVAVDADGAERPVEPRGWDHFAAR